MELRQLRALVAVSVHKGVRRAAQAINVSQPAVSRQLHQLEQELGVELFKRNAGLQTRELTPAGEIALGHARDVEAALKRLKREVGVSKKEAARNLRVGAIGRSAQHILAPALHAFHTQHPVTSVTVLTSAGDPHAQLEGGEIDFAIGLDFAARRMPQVSSRMLFQDDFVVVASTPKAQQLGSERALEDLVDEDWVFWLTQGSGKDELARVLPWPGGRLPKASIVTESADVERSLIEESGRLGVWSRRALARQGGRLACVYEPAGGLCLPVAVFWAPTRPPSPTAQGLIKAFEDVCAQEARL